MEKPIHVLHVLGGVGLGGAESRIMDLYRQMDREEIQFDFLVHDSTVRSGFREARMKVQKSSAEKQMNASENRSFTTKRYRLWEDISMCSRNLKDTIIFLTEGLSGIFLRHTGNFGWCRGI